MGNAFGGWDLSSSAAGGYLPGAILRAPPVCLAVRPSATTASSATWDLDRSQASQAYASQKVRIRNPTQTIVRQTYNLGTQA